MSESDSETLEQDTRLLGCKDPTCDLSISGHAHIGKREQQDIDGLQCYLSNSAAWKEPWERARKKVGVLSKHPAGCD